ncbi:hypothetical protein LEMLEM_LOCUS27378, partial [Lemmus lemmus]
MPTCRGSWMVQLKNLDPTPRRETPNCYISLGPLW